VETEAVVQLLQTLECEEVQGFCFCQPLKMDAATQFLKESSIQSFF
jgi:EAL domain-containing protein (putative c-di-GMP-specific phosphodiesterase class I)